MSELKAFKVTDNFCEYNVIIFEETRNKAKTEALYIPEFEYGEYIDITACRAKKFDKHAKTPGQFDFCGNADIFKENGWHCTTCEMCENMKCGLYE